MRRQLAIPFQLFYNLYKSTYSLEGKMKNKIYVFLLVIVVMGIPLALVFMLETEILNYTIGEVDSWIMFWGSYIGAIIGASVVYFVARLQINKQHEQQIESIKLENIQSTKREMRSFYLKNKLKKIEEMLILVDKLMVIVKDLYSDLTQFATTKHMLDNDEVTERKLEFEQRIDRLRDDYHTHYENALMEIYKLRALTNYVSETVEPVKRIDKQFDDIFAEVRNCYYTEAYKKYLVEPEDSTMLGVFDETFDRLVKLNVTVLQKELNSTLKRIKAYIDEP